MQLVIMLKKLGKVLSGFIRKIDKSIKTYQVEDQASLEKTLAGLKGE